MPFGIGKAEKRSEDESDQAAEEIVDSSQDAPDPNPGDGSQPADPPPTANQPEEGASDAMSFRPNFLDSSASGDQTPTARPPSGDAFFISVIKNGGAETHRFDDASEAQSFVAQLLEEGVPQEDVTAFSGRRVTLRVSHRPVVKLVASQDK